MKNNRFIILFILIITLLFPISCDVVNKKTKDEYTITYYILDELVEHTPSTYFEGEGVELEDYILDGYIFLGWYGDPYFTNEEIDVIDSSIKGNLILYGKVQKAEEINEKIELNEYIMEVEYGTSFTDAIKDLEVSYIIGNNKPLILSPNQYSMKHIYNPNQDGEYIVEVKYNNLSTSFKIIVKEQIISEPVLAPSDTETLYGVTNRENAKFNPPLESIGTQKILVIPVDFSDYPAPENMKKNIESAFFGSSEQTGWESLNSYYQKSSYNKLNIIGTVLPVYNTNKRSTYYNNSEYGDYEILTSALSYYDAYYDYSEYDNNKDGLIDAVYLVYSRNPDYENDNMWWAYTYEYYEEDFGSVSFDNVSPSFYLFASYHFLFETPVSEQKITYNLETFIHETGHILGIEDYYDYDPSVGPSGGLGGGDMMDYTVGDHNPFTKMILGWTTPYLATDDITISLSSFGESGECIIIPKKFNGTYFDEYYVIDYYTPDGLNQMEAGHNGLFSIDGIRIYHINAETTGLYYTDCVWNIYSYNNSDTGYKLISLVEADGDNKISQGTYGNYSENSDLFQEGDSFNNVKWYNGKDAGFTINIVSIENGKAIVEINFE